MADIVIGSLTDEKILEYSADRVITTNVDFNLKSSRDTEDGEGFILHPEPKGIYDPRYFGSIYAHSCNCGRVKKVGVTCELCGSMLMTDEMALSRFARIDMGFYYSTNLKFRQLLKYLKNNYTNLIEVFEEYPIFTFAVPYGDPEEKKYKLALDNACYMANIRWDAERKALIYSNKIDDPSKCGLDTLVTALTEAGDTNWKKYLNRYLIVTPARMRPVSIRREGVQKQIRIPDSSNYYSALSWLSDNVSFEMSKFYAKGSSAKPEDAWKMAIKKAGAIKVIQAAESKLTAINESSKANIARYSYKMRQPNSGRSVITGDPDLRIDEVGIPIHLAYEALKTDFIEHLKNELRLKRSEAIERYVNPDSLVMDMFKEYAETRKVILNRAPTLHKYNILCMNIKLVEDSSIHLPILDTKPFNADFDGDTMAFYVVPEDIDEYVEDIMSPRNIKKYEKNDSFMFMPSHEVLNGLALLSKMIKPKEVKTYDDLAVVKELIDENKMEIWTVFNFKGRETTWGREQISNIIGRSLDHIIGPQKISNKNISEVYAIINKYDNETRTKMIKELQDLALLWVTEYGVSTPTLKDLTSAVDHDFRDQVNGILEDKNLDHLDKFIRAYKLYNSREKLIKEKAPEIAEKLEESDRGKVHQLFEMSVPQFMVNDQDEIVIPQKPLIEGLTEREYITHSFNNRKLLAIKSMSVPAGGYLTRQLVFACQSLVINVDHDPENYGILLPRYRCEGRTTTSGERIGKSLKEDETDLVRVRSVVMSKKGVVSTDMFSDKFGFDTKNSRVGISMASSFTESLTQALLGLKHGGAAKQIPDDFIIKATEDCELIAQDEHTYTLKIGDEQKVYPLSSLMRFVEGTYANGKGYHKGDPIVELVNPLPPTLKLEMVIKLIGANSTLSHNAMTRANVTTAISYTLDGGKIHYDYPEKRLFIGSKVYEYDDEAAYYFAEGEVLPPVTKFRSGVMTPSMALPPNPTNEDIEKVYQSYRDQIYRISGKNIVNEDLMEVMFRSCLVDGVYMNVTSAVQANSSTLSAISYGWASRSLSEIIDEPKIVTNDPMSNVLLNYMMKEAAHKNL